MRTAIAGLLIFESLFAQQTEKPKISRITVLPSEPVKHSDNCKASTAGYLEMNGRATLSKAEIADFVDSSLQQGYVITLYPPTKRGLFVALECP